MELNYPCTEKNQFLKETQTKFEFIRQDSEIDFSACL